MLKGLPGKNSDKEGMTREGRQRSGVFIDNEINTQNPTSSGWLQSILFLSRFRTLEKHDEIKYVYLIPSSNNTWLKFAEISCRENFLFYSTYLGNAHYEFIPSIQNPSAEYKLRSQDSV